MHESMTSQKIKKLGAGGAKLGGGAKTFGGGPWPPPGPPAGYGPGYIAHSVMEDQRHNKLITPLTRVAFVYSGPKGMELAPNPH